jgi:hypothetical protein
MSLRRLSAVAQTPLRAAPIVALCLTFAVAACNAQERAAAGAAPAAPAGADKPKVGKLPHLTFDIAAKQVRVEAEALEVEAPLEFFCVLTNTAEHESVLRSPAKPSDIHTALLAIGLKPGRPVSYSEALRKWSPPQGPPLQVMVEWEANGKRQSVPAYRLMRDVKTKKQMPALTWVFVGSRQMEDGTYAADTTGYLISVVNFDLTLIDIPQLASNANESLEWERNPDLAPKGGTKVTLVIEPAGNKAAVAAPVPAAVAETPNAAPASPAPSEAPAPTAPAAAGNDGDAGLSDVQLDEKRVQQLREHWLKSVRPHSQALREAAQAHYDVMTSLRREQQRLIDEADRLQRAIDQLEKEYQDLTTPRPPGSDAAPAREPAAE